MRTFPLDVSCCCVLSACCLLADDDGSDSATIEDYTYQGCYSIETVYVSQYETVYDSLNEDHLIFPAQINVPHDRITIDVSDSMTVLSFCWFHVVSNSYFVTPC